MRDTRTRKGFTLAEMLMVIAIIGILAGVAFVAVQHYLRAMTRLEYDGYAREIFVAAQNHLTMVDSQGYLGLEVSNDNGQFGSEENVIEGIDDTGDGVYFFVIKSGSGFSTPPNTLLDVMLPFGAIDATVRDGGSYLIRYHKDSAQVLDVFYWSENSKRFAFNYSDSDYDGLIHLRDADKSERQNYGSQKAVIGYYGGAEANNLTRGQYLNAPLLEVFNAERLLVKVTNKNVGTGYENAKLKLIIEGETSGNSREIELVPSTSRDYIKSENPNEFIVTLDDITSSNKLHFNNLFCDSSSGIPGGNLIPGENILVQAVAYNNTELTNISYSASQRTNSLYADETAIDSDTYKGTAIIANIRHLENLSKEISNVNQQSAASDKRVIVEKAEQITDLSWREFKKAITGEENSSSMVISTTKSGNGSGGGNYLPVTPGVSLEYDGGGHSISWITVGPSQLITAPAFGGLFSNYSGGSIKDLKLVNFQISGTGDSGALAGTVSGTTVSNIVAYHDDNEKGEISSASGSAGGLIGSTTDGSNVEKCAAALIVSSAGGTSENAVGGLIGVAKSTAINNCYSGGHTEDAAYSETNYNVTGSGSAGGLVGIFSGAGITNSYSTCSVSGATAGGFVGNGSGSYTNCYSTGLVKGTSAAGAFAGVLEGASATKCHYYEIVNEVKASSGNDGSVKYLLPVGGAAYEEVTAFDKDAAAYNGFVPAPDKWATAIVYDPILNLYYQGGYCLPTVGQLDASGENVQASDFVSVHYGDWPAPETWTFN